MTTLTRPSAYRRRRSSDSGTGAVDSARPAGTGGLGGAGPSETSGKAPSLAPSRVAANGSGGVMGLGIRGLAMDGSADAEDAPTSSNGSGLAPPLAADATKSAAPLSPYTPLYPDSPVSPSSKSSARQTPLHMATPPSPSLTLPYSQYGTALNTFKAAVRSAPANGDASAGSIQHDEVFGGSAGAGPRASGSTPGRPMLMRTPPSDYPISGMRALDADGSYGDEERNDVLGAPMESPTLRDERRSSVADLPPSPARLAFARSAQTSASPGSPTPSMSAYPINGVHMHSPRSPSVLSPAPSHSTHGRMGSTSTSTSGRVHARNLSTFFPHPGQMLPPPSPGRSTDAPITDMPERRTVIVGRPPRGANRPGSMNGFTFGAPKTRGGDGLMPPKSPMVQAAASSMASTVTNPSLQDRGSPTSPDDESSPTFTSPPPSATPKPVSTPFIQGSIEHAPASISTPLLPYPSGAVKSLSLIGFLFTLAPMAQLALGVSLLEFFVGASLWVDGQAGGSVSITGLGYLVVYDALGLGIRVLGSILRTGEGSQSSLRRSFG